MVPPPPRGFAWVPFALGMLLAIAATGVFFWLMGRR
jgi:hypothetical protein